MTDSPDQPAPSEPSGAARERERKEHPRPAAGAAPDQPAPDPSVDNPYAARAGSGRGLPAFLRPSAWGASAAIAGITYGAMLLAAVVFSVLIVVAIRSETAGSLGGAGLFAVDDLTGLLRNGTGVYFVVALTVQLVSMALGGRMHLSVTAVESRSDLLHLSIGFLPVLITVVGAVALFICSRLAAARQVRRQERVAPDQVWLSSLVTAGLLTIFAMVLTMVLAGRATEDAGYAVRLHFWAVSPGLVICPLVFGTLLGVWARRTALGTEPTRVSDLMHQWVPGLAPAARLSALYLGALSVLGLILLSIGSGVEEGSFAAFLAVLLLGAFAGVDLVSMTHLGAVTAVARGDGGNARETLFLWSGGTRDVATAWPMLMWLFLLVGILILACAWAGRRPGLGRWTSWVAMPLVFFLAGLVTLMLGRVSAEMSVQAYSGYSARLSMGPAWWTPVVFALWGGVVEVLARYAVPHLAWAVPQGRARTVLFGAPTPVLFTQRAGNGGAGAEAAGAEAPAPVAAENAVENGVETAVRTDAQADARSGAEAAPLSPRAKKRLKISGIIAGALVLLLILAFAGVRIANATVYSPEHVVEEYFDAVVDGDAETATDLIDPNVPSAQRVLLTGDVYKDAGQRISGYDVKDVEVADDGQSATATVSVTQDQRSTDTTLQLTRAGGVMGLRQWEIAPDQSGLYKTVRVSVPAGQHTLTVNGHEVSVPASSASPSPTSGYHRGSVFEEDPDAMSLTVLPGEYTFAAPEGGKYLTYGDDQKVTVTADEDTSSALSGSAVEFRQRLTEQAVTDAAAKAKEKIDACVAKKEFKVAECGLNSYYEADDEHRNPSWSVEEYPTFMLTDGLNSTDTDPVDELETGQQLYVRTSESGKVKFSYQYRFDDDEPWEDKSTTSPLSGAFMITVTPEEITVQDSHSSNGY